ncbi:MAG TPA: peptide deformylase [Spirochaetota bacterium]|nr:peptide deformylase [Spirochaetota bacterium]
MRKLVYYGNETLRKKADQVSDITQETIDLIDSMFNIMNKESGIGLAAPQVDLPLQVVTIDIRMYEGPALALINPVITSFSDDTDPYEEGCLSLPGISENVIRPSAVEVKALAPGGEEIEFQTDGLLARVVQHELDHLNGILFIDHLEDYKRKELTSTLKKIKKMNRKAS